LQAHYVVQAVYGDGVRLARLTSGLLPTPPATLFDLTDVLADDGRFHAEQRIDRLALGYATPDFVVRVGRQALTWGGGLVFRPMDLVNPFAPNVTDSEFKPGADMVYAQWLFGDGSDLEGIIVPRATVLGAAPSANASSFAGQFRTRLGNLQSTWLVARDHGDWTAALELNGPWGGAAWDVELVPTFLNSGDTRFSALANISVTTVAFARNATLFAEYFHNGFGSSSPTIAGLPPDLIDRLARGQVFNLRRNYLAAGASIEWTPLLNASLTPIADLDDGSVFLLASATYSLADDMTLVAGAQTPIGGRGTEFGGIPLSPLVPARVGPASQIYVQLRQYF
jgi:hypothetical protein